MTFRKDGMAALHALRRGAPPDFGEGSTRLEAGQHTIAIIMTAPRAYNRDRDLNVDPCLI